MHLSDVLRCEMVWPHLSSTTKEDVIKELADLIAQCCPPLISSDLSTALLDREKLGSTGIENGIAIPHAKVPGLEEIIVACGKSDGGLDFDAHDSRATHLFFVLLAPEHSTGIHLKVLARLSRLLKEQRIRNKLIEAREAQDMYNIIIEEDNKL
jgi:PTS system nitrogen regulatory IIA component